MKEKILISGGSGMLAQHFVHLYGDIYDFVLLSRSPKGKNEYMWDPNRRIIDPKAFDGVSHVINLAGASLAGGAWTETYKKKILWSRVNSTNFLKTSMLKYDCQVKTFISASAVGFYGSKPSHLIFKEHAGAGDDFLSEVCIRWEREAEDVVQLGVAERLVIPRLGIIFCHYGGALPKILFGNQLNTYAIFGSGKQILPWIHINDLCHFFHHAINHNEVHGHYNLVAPEQSTYEKIIKTAAHLISRRKYFIVKVPAYIVKLGMGERSELLLTGNKISSEKVRTSGFRFRYPDIKSCIRSLYQIKA